MCDLAGQFCVATMSRSASSDKSRDLLTGSPTVLQDRVDDFQPKSSPKPAHFNKNQPKILTAKKMWYDFITMSIKINKDHFYLLKIK